MAHGSTIQARVGDSKVVSIKTCWPQDRADQLKALYPPDGVVDVDDFDGSISAEVERTWLKNKVLRALGRLAPAPIAAHLDRLLKQA